MTRGDEPEEEGGLGVGFAWEIPRLGPSSTEIALRFDELLRRRWGAAVRESIEVVVEDDEIRFRLPPHLASARHAEVTIERGVLRLRVRREPPR